MYLYTDINCPRKLYLCVCVCKLGHMNKTYYYKTCLKVLQYLQEDRSVRNTSQVTTGLRD